MSLDFSFTRETSGFRLDSKASLPSSGITAIFGQSGSGKTSLLRAIAGLDKHAHGYCCFNGVVWQDATSFLPTHKRNLSFVFQNPSLFPHLKVKKLLAYGQKARHSQGLVDKLIAYCDLEKFLELYPQELSGGQKQKVALAQALANKPQLLLMDEPLSSVDLAAKQKLLPIIKNLVQDFGVPVIYVSHSFYELGFLGETFYKMEQGQLTPQSSWQSALTHLDSDARSSELSYVYRIDSCEEQTAGCWLIDCVWGTTLYRSQDLGVCKRNSYLEISPDSVLIGNLQNKDISDIGAVFHTKMEVIKMHVFQDAILIELQSPHHREVLGALLSPERCRELSLSIGKEVIAYITKIRIFS